MSVVEQSYSELAIKDPKQYLNLYCEELSTLPGIDITTVCKLAKDDLGDKIPAHYFTDSIESKFKNQSQLAKSKLSHKEEMTREAKVKRFTNWLKKQPKDIVDSFYDSAIATVEPEIEVTEYSKN